MRTILTTVGTSLLTNAKHDLKAEKPNEQQLANYLRHTAAEKASAETNSLSRLLQKGDRVVFLHSQTEEGKRCADALRQHYAHQGYAAELREVPDLTYTESRFKMRGLRSLVATLIDLIRHERKQNREVLVNATGGFKAEIAYATLVGLLFDVPVFYIHEAFRDIIEMPPTPISWDYSLLADHEEFFEWVFEHDRPTQEVEKRLQALPDREAVDKVRLLLTEVDNVTSLSPTGEALFEAYLDRVQQAESVPVLLSSAARRTYEDAEPSVQQSFDHALRKLRMKGLRVSQADRVRNCDVPVFPKGHCDERVFFFEGEDGSVRVCELARHSDRSYDQLIARGVRREMYRDFEPLA